MFVILIVLYKKSLESSETLQSLLKSKNELKNSLLLVWDNSPNPMMQQSQMSLMQSFINFKYIHTPQNYSLSKIYNIVSKKYLYNYEYLALFDHDSEFESNYFSTLINVIKLNRDINLFLPIIYSQDKIVSPASNFIILSKLWQQKILGLMSSNDKTAINSGMTISKKVFDDGFEYDERMTYYGTDNYFMAKFANKYQFLFVVNNIIKHNLSFNTTDDVEMKLLIFKETKKTNLLINEDNFFKLLLTKINNLLVSIKLSIKYRRLSFLK